MAGRCGRRSSCRWSGTRSLRPERRRAGVPLNPFARGLVQLTPEARKLRGTRRSTPARRRSTESEGGALEGWGPAGRRPEGSGARKLAPGKGRNPASWRPGRDPPLSPRPGQAVAVARGAGVWKVWRDTGGRRTGGSRNRDGTPTTGADGQTLERSGISPVGNPRMARVSNHADPRSVPRGSKWSPCDHFEPRKPPATGSVTEMPGTPHFLPCCPTPTYALRVLTVL